MSAIDQLLGLESAAAWPEQFPGHLSASSLSTFERCPEIWRRRYVLGEKERPAGALIWGRSDHEAHRVNFDQKVASGSDVELDVVQYAFVENFDHHVTEAGGPEELRWDKGDAGDTPIKKAVDVRERGVRLVGAYHKQVSPKVQPIAVEHQIEVVIPKVPVPIIGYIDLETSGAVIERKTTGRKAVNSEWFGQSVIYQAAIRKPFEHHLSVKTKTPAVYTPAELPELRVPYNPSAIPAVHRLVQMTVDQLLFCWERYGPEQPWPGVRNRPQAACSYCGFGPARANVCAWWAM